MDLSPFLTQTVKTQFSANGELSHGSVTQDVHEGVQAGCRAAAGRRVSLAEVSRGLEVNSNVLHRWRGEFRQAPGNAFPGNGQRRWSEDKVAELEWRIGQQAVEIVFFDGVLAAHAGAAQMRLAGEREEGVPAATRRQLVVRAQAQVRGHHQFQPRSEGLSEPGRRYGTDPV